MLAIQSGSNRQLQSKRINDFTYRIDTRVCAISKLFMKEANRHFDILLSIAPVRAHILIYKSVNEGLWLIWYFCHHYFPSPSTSHPHLPQTRSYRNLDVPSFPIGS